MRLVGFPGARVAAYEGPGPIVTWGIPVLASATAGRFRLCVVRMWFFSKSNVVFLCELIIIF